MIAVFQLFRGRFSLDSRAFFDTEFTRDMRGHTWNLTKPRAVTRSRRNAFSTRVVNDWTRLPPALVTPNTVNQLIDWTPTGHTSRTLFLTLMVTHARKPYWTGH